MADNQGPWLKHLGGDDKPVRLLLPAAAGSTRVLKRGEMASMATGTLVACVAGAVTKLVIIDQEQKATDVARHIYCIIPRPDDLFDFPLSAARANEPGDPFKVSDSETLTYDAAGTNLVARSNDNSNRPLPEENSTTQRSHMYAQVMFDEQVSYWSQLTGNS